MGDFVYKDWGGSSPNEGKGRRGEWRERKRRGPKPKKKGEAGRKEGEGRGDDCVPLLVAAGEDLQRSVWGCDIRRGRRVGEGGERSNEGARGRRCPAKE